MYLNKRKNVWKKYKNINTKNFQIRNCAKYKSWRKEVLARDKNTCQMCGCTHKRLVVHHIKGFEKYPLLRFEISNGLTLCFGCHFQFHKLFGKDFFPNILDTDFFKLVHEKRLKKEKEVINE